MPVVQIEARYDGSCGFVYVGEARIWFGLTVQNDTLTTDFNHQWGALSKREADAVKVRVEAYALEWVFKKHGRITRRFAEGY